MAIVETFKRTPRQLFTRILPPVSPSGGHAVKKQAVIDRLLAFFDRCFGLA